MIEKAPKKAFGNGRVYGIPYIVIMNLIYFKVLSKSLGGEEYLELI